MVKGNGWWSELHLQNPWNLSGTCCAIKQNALEMDAYCSFPALFHEIRFIHMFTSFFLLKGKVWMLKISIYWHLYILENSRKKWHLFWVYYIKRKIKGRKKNLLHKEDKIYIFAVLVFRRIVLFEILVTQNSHDEEEKITLKKYIFICFMTKIEV